MLRRILSGSVVVLAITLVTASFAYADHSPSFYVEWDPDAEFTSYTGAVGNAGTGSPHQNYLETTTKCSVCHAVHRAPVPGVKWDTDPNDFAAKTPVAGNKYFRAEFESDRFGNTQMLLMSSVANACNYCHVDTAIGGKQIYAGNAAYISALDANGTDTWDVGFGHGNACVDCHAVHGAADNANDAVLYARYGVFEGPIRTKVLKVRVKDYADLWQDEVYVAGSEGKVDAEELYGASWASLLVVDDTAVDPKNVPLFPSTTDALYGTNTRPDCVTADSQVSVFCTFCHQNYGWASEADMNPDDDYAFSYSPWFGLSDAPVPTDESKVPGMYPVLFTIEPGIQHYKKHPMKQADPLPDLGGAYLEIYDPQPVAYAGASSCRSCHDAGVTDAQGVIIESWPHFTPGYFQFVKAAASIGATLCTPPPLPDTLSPADTAGITQVWEWLNTSANYNGMLAFRDGLCLKCHINATRDRGVGITF